MGSITLDYHLHQAYILVNKLGFSYSDVKGMTKIERLLFLKLYNQEQEALEARMKH